jgi:hypothetical protein
MVMIKQLIKLANHLDSKGLSEEADGLDAIVKSILQMIEGEEIDIKKTKEGDELVFDLFISPNGEVVGAEPASGDLGSTCIMNEEGSGDSEDFSNLDETNITSDEAFSAGCIVCGSEDDSCGHSVG